MPLTTAALELTWPNIAALYRRRYALKNRERFNRLLLLLQLHTDGDDDVQRLAKTIRTWIEADGGRSADRRCAIADPAVAPSLC